jgi:hypothetical protein
MSKIWLQDLPEKKKENLQLVKQQHLYDPSEVQKTLPVYI